MHCICAIIIGFDNRVSGTDNVGVVTGSTSQSIGRVVTAKNSVERIPSTVDGQGPGESQILNIVLQGVGHATLNSVDPTVCRFDHGVATSDYVDIVPRSSCKDIGRIVADQDCRAHCACH